MINFFAHENEISHPPPLPIKLKYFLLLLRQNSIIFGYFPSLPALKMTVLKTYFFIEKTAIFYSSFIQILYPSYT